MLQFLCWSVFNTSYSYLIYTYMYRCYIRICIIILTYTYIQKRVCANLKKNVFIEVPSFLIIKKIIMRYKKPETCSMVGLWCTIYIYIYIVYIYIYICNTYFIAISKHHKKNVQYLWFDLAGFGFESAWFLTHSWNLRHLSLLVFRNCLIRKVCTCQCLSFLYLFGLVKV